MSGEAISFFTIDHGTASRSAALVARLGGRFRLLAAGSTPAELPVEPLLEGLVRDVLAVEPSVLPHSDAWDDWARVESGTV